MGYALELHNDSPGRWGRVVVGTSLEGNVSLNALADCNQNDQFDLVFIDVTIQHPPIENRLC